MATEPIRDNLVRAIFPGVELREEADAAPRLTGHFARFNQWNVIDSAIEGRFLERIEPGAFDKTLATRTPKILFNHGKDPEIGDKVIATPRSFPVDDIGPGVDADVLDGLPQLVMSGLRAGQYGMSYRFSIPPGGDVWERRAKPSDYNPDGLPERTIREAMVFEAGPVTWPADAGTDVAVRSMTDTFSPRPVAPVAPVAAPAAPAAPPKEIRPVTDSLSLHPVDQEARIGELEAALVRQDEEITGIPTVEQQARWDADTAELAALKAARTARAQRRAVLGQIEPTDEKRTVPGTAPNIIRTKSTDEIYDLRAVENLPFENRRQAFRDNAMRSLEASALAPGFDKSGIAYFLDNRDFMPKDGDQDQELAKRILLTGSPAYKRFFNKYLAGIERAATPEEQRAAALAVTGTTTTGGYAVPYVFDPSIIRIGAHTAVNPYRAACRVETISGGNNWRAVTAGAITAKWDAEAAASVEGGPTFGQPTFTVQRADAFATVSIETLQDRPDITGELSAIFGEAKDTLEENSFTLGVGTTVYPQGMFLSGAFTVQSTATNDVTAISDLLLLESALPLRERQAPGAAMFMSRSTQRQLEALDTTGYYFKRPGQIAIAAGMPLQSNSPTGNTGTQVLGYPIWEVPSAVSTLTTDGAVIVVFCNPRNYVIVDRIGMNVEVIPLMTNGATPSFPTGQRGVYCYWRGTARVLYADGGRQLDVN